VPSSLPLMDDEVYGCSAVRQWASSPKGLRHLTDSRNRVHMPKPLLLFIASLWLKKEEKIFKHSHAPRANKVLLTTAFIRGVRPVRLAYQPPANSTFLSQQISHQQPANSTLLSEQTSTSHQPPANRTGCEMAPLRSVH
jgi:hypothetical protein